MCGRYTVIEDDDIAELRTIVNGFQNHISNESNLFSGENARIATPGMIVPILTQHGDFLPAYWGFRKWDGKGVVFNARSESLTGSGFFSPHLTFGRCIAPAREYFEWAKDEDNPRVKTKYRIFSPAGNLYLCALMRPAKSEGGFEYTIITKSAAPEIAHIHPRMPIALDSEGARKWLSAGMSFLDSNENREILLGEETG